jgi:hypothetical protein
VGRSRCGGERCSAFTKNTACVLLCAQPYFLFLLIIFSAAFSKKKKNYCSMRKREVYCSRQAANAPATTPFLFRYGRAAIDVREKTVWKEENNTFISRDWRVWRSHRSKKSLLDLRTCVAGFASAAFLLQSFFRSLTVMLTSFTLFSPLFLLLFYWTTGRAGVVHLSCCVSHPCNTTNVASAQ